MTPFYNVHGYNVSFDDAALRTAQLAYDLTFDCPAAFFSWPSKGTEAEPSPQQLADA
jgi:esterase/lipase superfamily enzyme